MISQDHDVSGFLIKPGYIENASAVNSKEEGAKAYWNNDRIRLNATSRAYVYLYVVRLMKRYKFYRYLDVGSGPALKVRDYISPLTDDITLVDKRSVEPLVRKTFKSVNYVGINLENGKYVSEIPFDIIVSSDVIEHLADPTNYLWLIKENLSKQGIAIITTPERDFLYGTGCMKSGNDSHVREWSGNEFKSYLNSFGFSVKKQLFYPMEPIPYWEYLFSRCLSSIAHTKRWSSCQILVCYHG